MRNDSKQSDAGGTWLLKTCYVLHASVLRCKEKTSSERVLVNGLLSCSQAASFMSTDHSAAEKAVGQMNWTDNVVRRGVINWWIEDVAVVRCLKLDDTSPSDTVGHDGADSPASWCRACMRLYFPPHQLVQMNVKKLQQASVVLAGAHIIHAVEWVFRWLMCCWGWPHLLMYLHPSTFVAPSDYWWWSGVTMEH